MSEKNKKQKNNKTKMSNNNKKIKALVFLWLAVFAILITIFCVVQFTAILIKPSTYYLINIIVAFSSFVATSFFGVSIFYHNASVRDQNNEIRHQTNSSNKRAEAFRNLQFISTNYSIIDFVDNMQIYEESIRYTKKLRDSKIFQFYLLEKGLVKDNILENFDDYQFLTVKLPISIIEGTKTISKLKIDSFKFEKAESIHRFVSPIENCHASALILFNEDEHRSEAVINLIMKKDSDFYIIDKVNQFLKIKIRLEMESLLGVTVAGVIELYFTNPEKTEMGGANRYKINSSQFEIIGAPKLTVDKSFNPD